MPQPPKTPPIAPKLIRALKEERTGGDPVIDGDEKALIAFLRRAGVVSTTHSRPALAKLVVDFLRHRKRH